MKNSKNMPKIISIANQKGGVGKTTTVANLASSLAEFGHKVLVVDCDYQANLTSLLCGDEQILEKHRNLTHAIKNDLKVEDVFVKSKLSNVDVVSSNKDLDDLREQLVGKPNQFKLVEFLLDSDFGKAYDFVLLDTHPSLDCFFQSAIAVSDFYIVPLFPEADSSRGLAHQIQAVEKTKKYLNQKLIFLGGLIVKYDKYSATHQKFEKLIREFGVSNHIPIFKTNIPNSQSVAAACAHGLTLNQYKKNSLVEKAYKLFSKEVVKLVSTNSFDKKFLKQQELEVALDL